MNSTLFGPAVLLACGLGCLWGKAAAAHPAPRPMSIEGKVIASDYIIIGKVIRIICRDYDAARRDVIDIEDERCNDRWSKNTDWVIEVDALLCRKALPDPHVLLRITPATELRTVGRQRRHYLGNKMIFFLGRVPVTQRDGTIVEELRFAKGRRIAFPQPLSSVDRVSSAVEKYCPA